jgi:hypothetical protein
MTMPARIKASEIIMVGFDVVLEGVERFLRDRSCRMRREVCRDGSCGVVEFVVVPGLGAGRFLFFEAS